MTIATIKQWRQGVTAKQMQATDTTLTLTDKEIRHQGAVEVLGTFTFTGDNFIVVIPTDCTIGIINRTNKVIMVRSSTYMAGQTPIHRQQTVETQERSVVVKLGNNVSRLTTDRLASTTRRGLMDAGDKVKLDGIPAEETKSDWAVTDPTSPAFIKNKPLGTGVQVQADWTETDDSIVSHIRNKPDLSALLAATVAVSLTATPTLLTSDQANAAYLYFGPRASEILPFVVRFPSGTTTGLRWVTNEDDRPLAFNVNVANSTRADVSASSSALLFVSATGVSTLQVANLNSPAFFGTPTAPTPARPTS